MKIRHLLLGLMICVAGTGAIDLSGGYLDDQNTTQLTPFLIFGHVFYEGGAPCNSPNVSITNLNTGVAWYADTLSDSNFYQTLLTLADVNAGDVLRWSATDGAVVNTTNRTVGLADIESGGIFDFDLILQSIAPRIIGYAPESQIRDIENAARRFNIKIDQVVDVTWLVNGSPAQTNESVTDASYTHTNVAVGVWNVSARASNGNGTAMQEWIWDVTTLPLPKITAFAPPPSVFVIYGNVSYEDGSACNSPFVVITNLNTSEELIADNRTGEGFYQLVTSSAFANAGNVLGIKAHKNGVPVGNAIHTVSQTDIGNGIIKVDINKRHLPDFKVTDLTSMPHNPVIGDLVTINVTIANSGEAEGETSVEFYDNKSINIERVLNEHPESPINDTITFPDALRIRVHFKSFGAYPMGNITIHNESRLVEWVNETGTDHWTEWCDGGTIRIESWNAGFTVDRYEAVLANVSRSLGSGDSTSIYEVWNLSDQSMGWAVNGTHDITVRVDPCDWVVESDETNNEKTGAVDVCPSLDFAVTRILFDQTKPVLGDAVGVSANITNYGTGNGTTVVGVYYDDWNIETKKNIEITSGEERDTYISTDNISLPPGVLGARLHFDGFNIFNGHVDICDKNGRVVERFYSMGSPGDYISVWTDCIYTDNITIRIVLPYIQNIGTYKCNFTIDRYKALIAEEPVTLNATESKTINASWRTGAAYGGAGDHNITAMVDPRNHFVEINETNNTQTEGIVVNGTDLTVTEIVLPYDPCYVGQDVDVTATIANIGAVDATNFTVEFLEGSCEYCSNMNTTGTPFTEVPIPRLNSSENMSISVRWNPAEINNHTITARIPYDATDNNETNNELSDCSDVEARYDFYVESVNVDPQTAEKGESVNITATVGCTGHGARNVSIAFFVNSTDFAGTLGERFTRIGTDYVHLEVNKTETVSMRWDVDVVGGCHLIAAVVNPDNELEELNPPGGTKPLHDSIRLRGDTGNNVKNCTLHVTRPDLDITNITLVPTEPDSGDMVSATAEIVNKGRDASSTVWFYMQSNESISGEAESGRVQTLPLPQLQPEVPVRFHFDYIEIKYSGTIDGSATDSQDEQRPVCFYVQCGGKYGGQYVKTSQIHYNTAGYEVMDNDWRGWDDVWTDWTNGTEIKMNMRPYTFGGRIGYVSVSIDRCQVRLGNRTVTLSAGESGLFTTEWDTGFPLKPGKNYTILANVEDQIKESRDAYLSGTDLAVTDLSTRSVVRDGDRVWVNATIENLGRMDATAFTVNFSEIYQFTEGRRLKDHVELINTTHIRGLGAGNSINIMVPWNASIQDIGDEWISDYTINVTILPLENTKREENETNNVLERGILVSPSRDFVVTNLSFFVNGTVCDPSELSLYDDVVMNATVDITNLANQGGSVDIMFYIDETEKEHEIGRRHITFDAGGGTEYAEINWSADDRYGDIHISGNHSLIVVLDPEGEIYEIDETNNVSAQEMRVNAPDLVLESLDLHPANPDRGEAVSINVTIANDGMRGASNVTLEICDWSERHIEDTDEQSGPGHEELTIKRENATAMRLYLDLWVEDECRVCINDSGGKEIIGYHDDFHGWTPWLLDNNITVVVTNTETSRASARVSKVYHLSGGTIDASTHNLGVGEEKSVAVNWNPSGVGERLIAATLDPDDHIAEYNESDNRLTRFISVQTADLAVSNLSFWQNGVEIGENDMIRHGDMITMTADIANTGVEDAGDFNARFLIDNIPIKEEPIPDLATGSSISRSANWSATVGDHLIKVEVDFGNRIDETNETDNIMASTRYVCGAELSGEISWETLGLHGEVLYGPTQPYDEDEVVITTTINNSGEMPANFGTAVFFNYTPDHFSKLPGYCWPEGKWINETYHGAKYIYLNVTTPVSDPESGRRLTMGDVIVYDGNGSEVAKPYMSCSILVYGDTTNVSITPQDYSLETVFDVYFYPIYQNETSRLFKEIHVPADSLHSIPMNRTVSAGNFTIVAVIDPGNEAPEDEGHREDNAISKMMCVKPTRDFVVTDVIAACTDLSDLDTTDITAEVANTGLRSGTTNVSLVDYEEESRTYSYHYDANHSLSYLPIPPDATLSGFQYDASRIPGKQELQDYENLTIIRRPGADAIELHFNKITLCDTSVGDKRAGVMLVHDENEEQVWIRSYLSGNLTDETIRVPGETAYIHTCKAIFDLDRYTTERELFKEGVALNSTKIWNESKDITVAWAAYTGDHIITATLDEEDEITEINESNNELSSPFIVNASRDPSIVELNITPEHPVDGDDLDITAVVTNNGSRHADFTFDLWAETIINEDVTDIPDADLITDLGDKTRYIRLLKHTNRTLAPGENMTVNTTWNDITISGSPEYRVIAIVDPTDEIDEINESNNEINRKIIMSYPDFTIGGLPQNRLAVTIKEIGGICGASDVTVRFESYETEECNERCGCIHHPGASNMQVYFDHIDARGRSAYVEVGGKRYSGGEFSDVWSPWVEGDSICIKCRGGGTWVDISEYRWGNVSDEQIDLGRFDREDVELHWEYECPQNIDVTVDPDNNFTELNENNNNETVLLYADLRVDKIKFVSPREDMLSLDAEKFVIDGYITNGGGGRNDIVFPVGDFNVTLEFRKRYPNGTIGDVVFNVTEHVEEPVYEIPIRFEFDPKEKFEVGGDYSVFLIADSSGDVCESNELYPRGEDNNVTIYVSDYYMGEFVYVHNSSGYTGGGELINVEKGEVHGRVVYTVGDKPSCCSELIPHGGEKTIRYTDVIPDDADVKFARIFLYWYMYHHDLNRPGYCFIPEIADVDVTFNGHSLYKAGNYTDTPGATRVDFGYGLYSYDATSHVTRGENEVIVRNNAEWRMGVQAIGLLVVYEDENKPLTKYWINEGADVMMPDNPIYRTGLPPGTATARFGDVEQNDTENVDAALLTVLGFYKKYGNSSSDVLDALKFNDRPIGSLVCEGVECGYWGYHYSGTGLGITKNKWEDVTDYLKRGDNFVKIHSMGNYMMPNNAFLRLIFPPDLNITNLTAPVSTVVGAHHSINTTIRNDGRSDAHDFNVTFYIDGKQMVRIPHLDLPAGENVTLHLYNWTPMMLVHVYNLTAAADVLSGEDWTEIETDNNAMTKRVIIEEGGFGNQTGPRGTGGGSNPTGGKFTEEITGRVMQGMKEFLSFGGGGGAGMFSLTEWIMKGAVWLVLLLFVGCGYRMEQRSSTSHRHRLGFFQTSETVV